MNIFQIPTKSDLPPDMFVGIIDCSGSMSGNWKWLADHWNRYVPKDKTLTITFDHRANIVPSNELSSDIKKHGNGTTNILKAFKLFEEQLEKVDLNTSITLLFISDGHDNCNSNLKEALASLKGNTINRKLNFLCLGVGSGFPTFISMQLREKYHRGNETIPAIFLIEFVTEKGYNIKFEAMKQYFSFAQERKIEPPVCVFPWREYSTQVFEGSWVMSDDDTVLIDGEEIEINEFHLNLQGLTELFRSWSQAMHLESLKKGEDIKTRAIKTFSLMTDILKEVQKTKGIDFLNEFSITGTKAASFKERAWQNHVKNNYSRIKWFYNDVKNVAEGVTANEMNEFDAAKKIGTGTVVGNYQQKVNNLINIRSEDFFKLKKDFIATLKAIELHPNALSTSEIKDAILEKDFVDGINICANQFDLISSFPLIGNGLVLKRNTNRFGDIWSFEVKNILQTVSANFADIYETNGAYPVEIEGKTVNLHAVLPLFNKYDEDINPLIQDDLFSLIITYELTLDIDRLEKEAYIALLGNALIYFYSKKKQEDNDLQFINRIYESVDFLMSGNKQLSNEYEKFLNNPIECFTTLIEKDSSNITKNVFFLLYALHQNKISSHDINAVLNSILCIILIDYFKADKKNITKFFKPQHFNKQDKKEKVIDDIEKAVEKHFADFRTLGDFKRFILSECEKYLSDIDVDFIWEFDALENIEHKFDINFIKRVRSTAVLPNLSLDDYKKITMSAFNMNKELLLSEDNYMKTLFATEEMKIRQFLKQLKKKEEGKKAKNIKKISIIINSNKTLKDLVEKKKSEFIEYFRKIHKHILPISAADVNEHNKKLKEKLIYNEKTQLLKNACLAPDCKYYLKPMKRLAHHFDIWGYSLPKNFHETVKDNFEKSADEIYTKYTNSHKDFAPAAFSTNKNAVLEYIEVLKEAYKKLHK